LSFADGFPLLIIGQASLTTCPRGLAARWPWSVSAQSRGVRRSGLCRGWMEAHPHRHMHLPHRQALRALRLHHRRPDTGRKALDQEPLRTLAKYRKTPDGVIFGQNVIAEGDGELRCGMDVEILE
jgi:uncharacterized protein YcbX